MQILQIVLSSITPLPRGCGEYSRASPPAAGPSQVIGVHDDDFVFAFVVWALPGQLLELLFESLELL